MHLVVVDETRLTTKLLLFDNHAVQLLRQPCTELAGPMLNDMVIRFKFIKRFFLVFFVLIYTIVHCSWKRLMSSLKLSTVLLGKRFSLS